MPHNGTTSRQAPTEELAPGVEQLRQDVAVLRRDVDGIQMTMQEMQRERQVRHAPGSTDRFDTNCGRMMRG